MSALRPNQREKAASKNGAVSAALLNGLVDPTKTGKYPVLLSDTLLGRTQKDVFTGVRYNHKPPLASDPALSRLKPSTPGDKEDFELSYQDDGATYSYAGSRTTEQGQYVLCFDAERKAFILDKVDSTFNMNLTRTPDNTDPSSLEDQFPHIDTSIKPIPQPAPKATPSERVDKPSATKPSTNSSKPAAKPASKPASKATSSTKATHQSIGKAASTKKKPLDRKKPFELALPGSNPAPQPKLPTTSSQKKDKPRAAPAPAPKRANDDDDEEEEEDDDFGLTIEYPDDPSNARSGGGGDFSPAFPAKKIVMRRFSEFLRDSEADDADGESDPEEDDGGSGAFKLPSPVNGQPQYGRHDEEEEDEQLYRDAGAAQHDRMDVDSPEDADQDEMDLEADLEAALEAANSGDAGEESEVSEED
ncbi:ELL-associated factor [Plectosphaerella plurivora]|uniref:ELL-associated factor n=1 Tax=Plectosphaerella plurivora TaxID=936078 RepID=A0A9P8VLP3_9PEZI|nr:ELL-associated factor [Plectosphaerella plurivora]